LPFSCAFSLDSVFGFGIRDLHFELIMLFMLYNILMCHVCDLHMFSWQQPLKPAMQMQIKNKTENKNGHAVCSLESKVKA